jgi:hypothetical protein
MVVDDARREGAPGGVELVPAGAHFAANGRNSAS